MKGYNSRSSRRNGSKPGTRQPIDPGNKLDIQRTLVWSLAYAAQHIGQGAADQLLGLTGHVGLRADVDATKSMLVRLATVMSGNGNMRQAVYPFTIGDVSKIEAKHTFGVVRYGGVGLGISIDGFGEKNSGDGEGSPVWLEIENGVPSLKVWADITSEDPTHIISLGGAAEALRIPEPEGEANGQESEPQEEAGEDAGVQTDGNIDEEVSG